ncbi:Alpha/Beta hydrolase protein [Rhodocollybia butyracea]|uniref:acylaminoacyl-peptidase n=1 Tax=Rhodocollybia butyracea TaxID=206335 RepID=A0A9P5UCP6_9AGAR|nr:Alpha/Beta hydrolase protein [Rhodocollybia butyracea]
MSIKNYDDLTAIPVPTLASLHGNIVAVQLSVRDHIRNLKRTISKSILLDALNTTTPSVEVIGIVSTAYSASGNLKAVLRETGEDKDKKRFVEVWNSDRLLACKDVTDIHGMFYADDYFSSLCFSHSEKSILYVAEKKKITEKNSAEKFRYRQSFGEGLVGKIFPVSFLFEWQTDKLVSLTHDSPVWFGQARFKPFSDDKIFATGYETASGERLLGIKGCYNRPTGIWELTVQPSGADATEARALSLRKLTPPNLSCRTPRLVVGNNGETTLLWLSQPTGGAHWATASLHSLDVTSSVDPDKTRTLVDAVWEPAKGEFPGLYLDGLPRFLQVHSGQGDYIVTPTVWGSRSTIILISLNDGTVKELTPLIYSPYELVLGELGDDGSVSWKIIHKSVVSEELQVLLDSLEVKIVPIPGRFPTETILVQHKSADKNTPPCITMPHGGPHGTEIVAFSPPIVSLALEGYTLSLPNYTGSLGFGEKYVRALIGQCGTLDVGDCIESVRHLVNTGVAGEGRGKLFLSGGSHGGFLLGHLIGQYPEVFTAAALRNPVISCGNVSTSDIQDWYFSEFGIDYPLSSLPLGYTGPTSSPKAKISPPIVTPEVYSKLYHASPIAHAHNVIAAVLLLIGDSDQRVAPTQGIEYYHALKAFRGDVADDVEMLMFDGQGHPLDGPEASKVGWLRTVQWFKAWSI